MSFRLFVYYCAFCGAWAALMGWIFGRLIASDSGSDIANAGVKGMLLGLLLALGLGAVDALLNHPIQQLGRIAARVGLSVVVGGFGGLIGGVVGQVFYGLTEWNAFLVFGWTITGLLIGASLGVYDILARILQSEDLSGALKKILHGAVGGTVGGVLGGIVSLLLKGVFGGLFSDKPVELLWSPSATGFVALGLCIGLLIGLAQVILKEAWVRVEQGFRAGRQLILSKPSVTIGRAESCDIGLFGDSGVEKLHARIVQQPDGYYLTDDNTPGGTFLNGERIRQPTLLHNGDLIKLGSSVLRFGERRKKAG
ncbi:MAG: FHA domain-containing protein [Gemmataceae bacterium]|nr:FHA domain-containing protein [Gemmataceae bacterium]MDW8266645.1 FHA domain-containing protein [Gemmataceae bacterium]